MRPKNQAPEVSARADQSERSIEPVRCEVSSGKRRDADWPKVTNQREGHDRDQKDTRSLGDDFVEILFNFSLLF